MVKAERPLSGPRFSRWLGSSTDGGGGGESNRIIFGLGYSARDKRVFLLLLKSIGICHYLPHEASGSVGTLLCMDLASMSPH